MKDDPIIFPTGGSLPKWFSTVDHLIELVKAYLDAENMMINCGHATALRPALEVLRTCRRFMENIVSGKEAVKRRYVSLGAWWLRAMVGSFNFSLICPEKLVLDAKGVGVMVYLRSGG
jgi:hypothetical protein